MVSVQHAISPRVGTVIAESNAVAVFLIDVESCLDFVRPKCFVEENAVLWWDWFVFVYANDQCCRCMFRDRILEGHL